MRNRLYDTVFNFAVFSSIFIKLGYWSNHSPLVELRSFFLDSIIELAVLGTNQKGYT